MSVLTPGTTSKATIEEHVENLLSIKAITPKAWACGARPPVPTQTRTLLVPVPIISCTLITITQTAEGLGDSCSNQDIALVAVIQAAESCGSCCGNSLRFQQERIAEVTSRVREGIASPTIRASMTTLGSPSIGYKAQADFAQLLQVIHTVMRSLTVVKLMKRREKKKKKRKEKTTPFGVNLSRSPILYRAAQVSSSCILCEHDTCECDRCHAHSSE